MLFAICKRGGGNPLFLLSKEVKGMKKMKKKGFTLIELLAVIVILAIIALIATPMIMGVIEKARKGAAIQSVNGLLEAGEQYQAEAMLDGVRETEIDLTGDTLDIKGSKPDSGELIYDSLGNMSIIAKYGKYCIEKKFLDEEPTIVTRKECEMKASEKANQTTKIYGVKRNIESESTEWERIDDGIDLTANAQIGPDATNVKNDFDSVYPWSDIETYTYDVEKKEVTSWYNEEKDKFKFDGSKGEVLTYIPTFYYKRYQENGYEYILISNKNIEGYTRSDEFSIGRYTMSLGEDEKVHSKSGVQPLTSKKINEFREYARKLGSEFNQLDYHYFIIQLLYLVEYADYDSQEKLGKGYTSTSNATSNAISNGASISSGGCNDLGMKSGTLENDGKHSMIYRGMEDIYGNIWQFVDGINIQDHQAYVCYDPSKYQSDKFDGCYQPIGYKNSTNDGWVTKLGYDSNNPLISFPTNMGGSDSTYIPDYYWQANGNMTVRVGDRHDFDQRSGLWNWAFHSNSSLADGVSGARLIKTN